MPFSFGIVKFNYVLLNWIVVFYIVLCSSVLDYDLLHCIMQNQIIFTDAIAQFCSSVLYYGISYCIMLYGKVIYAYVVSFVALSVQNLD